MPAAPAVPDPRAVREDALSAISDDAGAGSSPTGARDELSDRDHRILALEGRTFRYVGAKERAIREEIGISKVAYFVRLNALLEEPAALRAAPSVVHRLRGRRTSDPGAPAADGDHRVA
ncbi:MAG: DUF3263 domain-containing protein [Brachybacterium sp.]|nr:DUF3263 domain-containing protein [Brachybacterium sp.]